jgi:hypothetical protein
MDQVYIVRHKVLVEKLSKRGVARELGIGRNSIQRHVAGAQPGVREPAERRSPVMERVQPRIEQLLGDAPRWTGGKYASGRERLDGLQQSVRRRVRLARRAALVAARSKNSGS